MHQRCTGQNTEQQTKPGRRGWKVPNRHFIFFFFCSFQW